MTARAPAPCGTAWQASEWAAAFPGRRSEGRWSPGMLERRPGTAGGGRRSEGRWSPGMLERRPVTAAGRRIARCAKCEQRHPAARPTGKPTIAIEAPDPALVSAPGRLEPPELADERARIALRERRQEIVVVDLHPVEQAVARAGHEHQLAVAVVHVAQLADRADGAVLEQNAHAREHGGLDRGADRVVLFLVLLVPQLPLDRAHLGVGELKGDHRGREQQVDLAVAASSTCCSRPR